MLSSAESRSQFSICCNKTHHDDIHKILATLLIVCNLYQII
jgi:hypothetical protein